MNNIDPKTIVKIARKNDELWTSAGEGQWWQFSESGKRLELWQGDPNDSKSELHLLKTWNCKGLEVVFWLPEGRQTVEVL